MKRMLIAALALAGVFVALYLTLYKMGMIGNLACTIGGCEQVNTSRYAEFFGIPVAAWGLGFYIAAFAVAFVGTLPNWIARREPSLLLVGMSAVGVLFSGWLTYLELYVIHAICQYCVVSAVIVAVIFLVSVLDLRDQRA
jgi:uncharacterized membrane protein